MVFPTVIIKKVELYVFSGVLLKKHRNIWLFQENVEKIEL